MKLFTKLATGAAAVGLAATGALAVLGAGSAAAHVPTVVHLANTTTGAPAQVTPTPAPNTSTTAEPASGTEAPDTGAEAATEPANEPTLPGGGHADAPGATVDHQFDGVE